MDTPQIPDAAVPLWERLGLTEQDFLAMPPAWRLDQARRFAPPPVRRRPVTRALTPAELAALQQEGLTGAAYTERARQLQQTPAP